MLLEAGQEPRSDSETHCVFSVYPLVASEALYTLQTEHFALKRKSISVL